MIWSSKELELMTQKIEILTTSISDHNPIRWQLKMDKTKRKRWIINEDLLHSEENIRRLKEEINEYFKLNDEVKTTVVWDAFKAVLRGQLIKLNAITKSKREEKYTRLNKDLEETEKKLKKRPGNKKLERQLRMLKQQRNNLDNQEIIWNLRKLNQKYFERANKPGKFLANQLKKRKE